MTPFFPIMLNKGDGEQLGRGASEKSSSFKQLGWRLFLKEMKPPALIREKKNGFFVVHFWGADHGRYLAPQKSPLLVV